MKICEKCGKEAEVIVFFDDFFDTLSRYITVPMLCTSCKNKLQGIIDKFVKEGSQ